MRDATGVMDNSKLENMLNLALDATEAEREKSLNLDVGYDRQERTWELIVKYSGLQFRIWPWCKCS